MNDYFFDSYALIEILNGSDNYKAYLSSNFIITKLNLFEVYYKLLQTSQKKADSFLQLYLLNLVDFDETTIAEACKFKLANKKKNLSMTDCIGYIISLRTGLKFLTGDIQFKDQPNVEFVR